MQVTLPFCANFGQFDLVSLLGFLIFFAVNILSGLLLISTPISPLISLVHLNVAVGEVNGSLILGTLGYCLKVPDQNDICPYPRKLAYTISQFFSKHRIPVS